MSVEEKSAFVKDKLERINSAILHKAERLRAQQARQEQYYGVEVQQVEEKLNHLEMEKLKKARLVGYLRIGQGGLNYMYFYN